MKKGMKKCKCSKCNNMIKEHKKIMFCSRKCYTLLDKVIKIKKCALESCHNTFEVINGAKQFCSLEWCKKKTLESRDRPSVAYIKKAYDYNYFFVFSTNIKDWISSPNPSKFSNKKRSSLKKKDEKVFLEWKYSKLEEVSRAG